MSFDYRAHTERVHDMAAGLIDHLRAQFPADGTHPEHGRDADVCSVLALAMALLALDHKDPHAVIQVTEKLVADFVGSMQDRPE